MGDIPDITVTAIQKQVNPQPGMSSRIAVIGAFDTTTTTPILCKTVTEAYENLGTDTDYMGVKCIEKLFYGASSIIAVNTTVKSDNTVDTTLTPAKLTTALSKIKGENFDTLFLAYELDDVTIASIESWLNETFKMKKPAGYIGACQRNTEALYTTTAGKVGDHCYGLVTNALQVNDTNLSLIETAAYYAGVVASLNVGKSMTYKTMPDVTGLVSEYTFETGDLGTKLVNLGFTVFKCLNREEDKYIVVNSEQPNGLDLYINRTRDFVVKSFALEDILGDRNNPQSLTAIKGALETVRDTCVNKLDLLKDIQYSVEKTSKDCVEIHITSLKFDGIIVHIKVDIQIEVE